MADDGLLWSFFLPGGNPDGSSETVPDISSDSLHRGGAGHHARWRRHRGYHAEPHRAPGYDGALSAVEFTDVQVGVGLSLKRRHEPRSTRGIFVFRD
jgi:hypothetical protein